MIIRIATFLKATTLGGLFVILPVVIVFVFTTKAVIGVRTAVQSMLGMIAGVDSPPVQFPVVFAALLVVTVSFLLGLMMISRRGLAAGTWAERALLFRIPGYLAARAMVGGLINVDSDDVVRFALLTLGEGRSCFAFVTEDHGNGLFSVFIPGSPNASSGSLQIVEGSLVKMMNVRMTDAVTTLQLRGIGAAKILADVSPERI